MKFYIEKDLGVCGLACVLCSSTDCPGCKARGCEQGCDCSVYQCATRKGLDGCYQCDAFPCGEGMHQGMRNRVFNRYAIQYGKQNLLERLAANAENDVTYHKPDGQKGDYDILETEDEIWRLIRFGSHDLYAKCPVLETNHFTLRLVRLDDAEDLLTCYSDPESQEIFDAENCTSDFRYQTLEEMNECIRFFLLNYENRGFVRFSIVNKETGHAVGTVEMFNATGHLAGCDSWGVLRLDLASAYEKQPYIEELLACCLPSFYGLFDVELIVTKAIPEAKERVASLRVSGFTPFEWPDTTRKHYWRHNKA